MARNNDLGAIRRSQVITQCGPGAIVDFRAGPNGGAAVSVIAAGLDLWDTRAKPPGLANRQIVREPRLQRQLGVSGFRLPPVAPKSEHGSDRGVPHLVGVRFPAWLQCPQCSRIDHALNWQVNQPGDPALLCPRCSNGARASFVAPVRFVVACELGHIDDFPWDFWVDHRPTCDRNSRQLFLRNEGGAGLAGLILRCGSRSPPHPGCGASRSMEGSFGKHAIGIPCRGKSPWLPVADEPHSEPAPRVLQRGASNLYFAATVSALDIPPWSDRLQRGLEDCWDLLADEDEDDDFRRKILKKREKAELLGLSVDEILRVVRERMALLSNVGVHALRREEYQQFTAPILSEIDEDSEFEVRPEVVPAELGHWVARLVRATRLREVRALRGFTRIKPPPEMGDESEDEDEDARELCRISAAKKNWLPAVEVRGEGIFVELNLETLRAWERGRAAIIERTGRIASAHLDDGGGPVAGTPVVTPRVVLVHSLAHALIRQLSLECGYSSASLRERIYVSPEGPGEMAGFLIYTAAADADGTLGGLSRQGRPEPFLRLLDAAIRSIEWCSSDPLCIEGTTSLSEPTNAAACHACLLAAETSCELFNRFLDRATIVGLPGDRGCGYFDGLGG